MYIDPITFRRTIHAAPELSFCEEATATYIEQMLSRAAIPHRRIAGTGVLATLEGRGNLRRAVVLRADIDALPIEEQNALPFASTNKGVMHACGHDMHAAMLYGALCRLSQNRDFEGTILGLFQPGEECNPGGATLVLAEHPFDNYDVVGVVGGHVDAQLEVGEVGFRCGKYMASSDEIRFEVEGKGGHAAMRSRLNDPVAATAEFVTALLGLNTPERVVSIGVVEACGATNVIPHSVRLEGTMRTFDEADRAQTKRTIAELADQIGLRHKVSIGVDINHGYPTVVNDEELTSAAIEVVGREYSVEMLELRATAEDFGFYGLHYPSLFYRVGVGAAAGASHSSTFCPDEGAIDVGVSVMNMLALRLLDYEKK